MKIAYVVHQYPPRYFTGTEQYVHAIAREMGQRGHEVRVFALDPFFGEAEHLVDESNDRVDEVPVTRLRYWMTLAPDGDRQEYRNALAALRFARFLDREKPDLVHVFHLRALGADLIDEAWLRSIPVHLHLMDFWFLCPAVVLRRPSGALCEGPPLEGAGCVECMAPTVQEALERQGLAGQALIEAIDSGTAPQSRRLTAWRERPAFLRVRLLRAAQIYAPSHFLRQMFAANGIPEERLNVLSYGVDLATDSAPDAAQSQGSLRIAFVGSIAEHKGVHTLVEAVQGSEMTCSLDLYGRLEDFPDYAQRVQDLAGGDPRIRFRGPFAKEQRATVFAAMDLLVVPSLWYENTPFVALEAQASGVPVCASDLGGLSELVRSGVDGELFPAGDVGALRTVLERLAAEPRLLSRYRENRPGAKTLRMNCDEIEQGYRVQLGLAASQPPG